MEEFGDISKMKVADLKKHLKGRGLPVTGNKTELVDRLQKSLQGGNEPINSGGAGEEEDFDEEEILGDEALDDDDHSKITPQEEAAVLAGTISIKDPEKKKISLKRSQPSLKSAETEMASTTTPVATDNVDSASAAPNKETPPTNGTEPVNTDDKENEEDLSPKKKIMKISVDADEEPADSPTKSVTKKTITVTDEEKKQARLARFGPIDNKPQKLSMETGGVNPEQLKKRADRFGEITSKTLGKLDSLEKKKKRQERFETETSTEKSDDNATDDAKAARAARFGTNTTDDDELKKKRADRFAAN